MGLFQHRTYRILHRKWPKVARKATLWLMPVELAGLITVLVIYGISQPDLYRSRMWHIGYEHGLNSNPSMVLYAYANNTPLPKVPLVWSRTLTDFNVAISVISLFFLLSKMIAFIMKLWFPIVATFINTALLALYAVSVYGQVGPDYADPRYPAPAAWYFRFGCDLAKPYGAYKGCRIAQGSLAATLYMLVTYILNLAFSAYAMWPRKTDLVDDDDEDDMDGASTMSHNLKEGSVSVTEMQRLPPVSSPFTPRTQAFHTLDRRLPLREQPGRQA